MAGQTFEAIAVLPLKEIDDETIVALLVNLPFLFGGHLWRKRFECRLALGRHFHGRRWLLDPVEIFVQPVENEREELLRVVLLVGRRKLGCKAHDRSLHPESADETRPDIYKLDGRRTRKVTGDRKV